MIKLSRIACMLVGVFFYINGISAEISISPLRVDFDKKHPIAVITISNPGDAPLQLQTSLLQWMQVNAKDNYTPSRDVIIVPPMFTIPPHQKQIVRIALKKIPADDQEKAYRLLLKEIPQPIESGKPILKMALEIRIPMFLNPQPVKQKYHWTVIDKGKSFDIMLMNQGNNTLMISELGLQNQIKESLVKKQSVFTYLMPQQTTVWNVPKSSKSPAQRFTVIANLNGREVTDEASTI